MGEVGAPGCVASDVSIFDTGMRRTRAFRPDRLVASTVGVQLRSNKTCPTRLVRQYLPGKTCESSLDTACSQSDYNNLAPPTGAPGNGRAIAVRCDRETPRQRGTMENMTRRVLRTTSARASAGHTGRPFATKIAVRFGWVPMLLAAFCADAATINASPSDYLSKLRALDPGDTLQLAPGNYDDPDDVPGLPFFGMHGEPGRPIVVQGPASGPRAVILGRSSHNTVRFSGSSYIVIRNLEIDGRDRGADAVNAQGVSHNITLDNLYIHGVGSDQQIVGISTKAPAWDWTIRNCVIEQAGTGIYLGNSDGSLPFVRGVIENNLIFDTIGYNMQIKHQNPRSSVAGMPVSPSRTIIRNNVFSKKNNSSGGGLARPNLLLGTFPQSGPGRDDIYEVYGNFLYSNPSGEPLMQAEGNLAIYNNLFVNPVGEALWIQPHHGTPNEVRVFNNTVVARDLGIRISGGSSEHQQTVVANAAFAATPIQGGQASGNTTGSYASASNQLGQPFANPGAGLDLYPLQGKLKGPSVDTSSYAGQYSNWDRDFNGALHDGTFKGAYAGQGANPGWQPGIARQPASGAPTPPPAPLNLRVR